jgi:type II secretory pathway component GspD/PulD (secretin)
MSSARRQVLIEATIIEVGLSDGYQQGIEWSRLTSGTEYSVTKPALTTNVPSAVTPYVLKYRDINPLNLLATVELLRAFGTVKVLSSPKLAVLNNQTATLKVSEEFRVFRTSSQHTVPGGPNTNATVTTDDDAAVGFDRLLHEPDGADQ